MGRSAGPGEAGYWVDAAPFRAHLHHLMGAMSWTAGEVAVAAGISARLAEHLAVGRNGRTLRRVSRETGCRLMAVSVPAILGLRWLVEPSGRARWQLDRLRQAGWDDLAVAQRVGSTTTELARLSGGAPTCSRWLAVRLVAAARAEVGPAWSRPDWLTEEMDGAAA